MAVYKDKNGTWYVSARYGLAPEDWIVMALEYLVCPATKDLAAKWLCQEKQAILRRK